MTRSFRSRAVRLLAKAALESSVKLEKFGADIREHGGKVFAQLMTATEREEFSLERYSASAWEPRPEDPLPAWEAEWFEATLPRPPARLLVAACGTGRELLPLLEKGYVIDAFDGAEGALRVAERTCAGRARLRLGTYDDLATAQRGSTSGMQTNALADFAQEEYSAVILGWGSLTHVAGKENRRAALRACLSLTKGPVLVSFYSAPPKKIQELESDPYVLFGRKIERSLRRDDARRDDGQLVERGPALVQFSHWGGFAEYVTKLELASHGAALGVQIEWDEGNSEAFPHVTLRRTSDSNSDLTGRN
jgi:hypothetical protein